MIKIIKRFGPMVLLAACVASAWAQAPLIKNIQFTGLKRVPVATAMDYLPFKTGEQLNAAQSRAIIHALYQTGFFSRVTLDRQGSKLLIVVRERPVISKIEVRGSREVPPKQLNQIVKDIGLEKGKVFQQVTLDKFINQLTAEYNNRGKYSAAIKSKVKRLSGNRVSIEINVSEGRVARIKSINIIGNKAYSDWTLQRQLALQSSGLLSYFNKQNHYSKPQLEKSLESLRDYYLNNGYLKFRVESTQVLMTPDKRYVDITLKVTEGPQYKFAGFDTAGRLVLPESKIKHLVTIRQGSDFNRQLVLDAVKQLGNALGDQGYAFPNVQAQPKIDEAARTVFITFFMEPGRHYYVRQINFSGNTKTAEYVLRRAVRQEEGEKLSQAQVKESERQLNVLGYLKDVDIKSVPVAGTNNQVDLNVSLQEAPSAEMRAQVALSRDKIAGEHLWLPTYTVGLNQHNFMGTGQTVGFSFNTSKSGQNYSINHYDPFLINRDIGGGYSFYYQHATPEKLGLAGFSSDRVGGDFNLNITLSDHASWSLGAGFQHLDLNNLSDAQVTALIAQAIATGQNFAPPPSQLRAFARTNGTNFNHVRLTTGLNYNSYDRFPYPTQGANTSLTGLVALPADADSLEYYKVGLQSRWYMPLYYDFIMMFYGNVSYGDRFGHEGLPFFENYFGGGIAKPGLLRGFDSYSLGPKDMMGNPLGGNLLVNGSVNLILPKPLSRDTVRTSVFIDGANVYSYNLPLEQQGSKSGPFRFSAGVAVDWRSPFGPLSISAGWPIQIFAVQDATNPLRYHKDGTNVIQFSLSSTV